MKSQPNVLLVEGNAAEEKLVRQIVKASEIDCTIRVAHDGVEACKILFESGEPNPTFILLDLNTPRLSGFELLTLIRERCTTRRIPVIVLTTSGDDADVSRCLDLHANSYVQKDGDLEIYEARLKLILYYWIAVNRNVNT